MGFAFKCSLTGGRKTIKQTVLQHSSSSVSYSLSLSMATTIDSTLMSTFNFTICANRQPYTQTCRHFPIKGCMQCVSRWRERESVGVRQAVLSVCGNLFVVSICCCYFKSINIKAAARQHIRPLRATDDSELSRYGCVHSFFIGSLLSMALLLLHFLCSLNDSEIIGNSLQTAKEDAAQ